MRKDFLKFQVSKEAMKEIKGGQSCHCGGSSNKFSYFGPATFEAMDAYVGGVLCGGGDWACSR